MATGSRTRILCTLAPSLLLGTSAALAEPRQSSDRAQSWKRHVELRDKSPFRHLEWRPVGPRKQGGRIESIAIHPENTSTIYVGVGSGNLWKSINNGLTWKPVFENESSFSIGDVAIAPSNADVIWVGTGEELMARSSFAGTGVFKSTDAGESWTHMGLEDTHHIGRVLVHPEDPGTVFVAAIGHLYSDNEERGVFKTTDGGATWRRVLYVGAKAGAIDLELDPSDADTLFATTWQHERKAWGHEAYGSGSRIYKSTDGGEEWRRLENGLPTGDDVGRIAIHVAPSNPAILYALVDRRDHDDALYRSDDRGESWRKVNEDKVDAGYDFCIVRVAPDNPDEVYLPGQRTVFSADGGKTFDRVGGTVLHLLPHGSKVLHLDAHAFWVNPQNPRHVVAGNDGGLHVSYDRCETWLHLNNLPIGEFYAVWADESEPYTIFGGTQDNAALFGPANHVPADDAPDPWQHVYLDRWGGGDSYFTYPDPSDPDFIYYEHQFGDLRRKNMVTGKSESIRPDRGSIIGFDPDEPELRTNWMTPYFVSRYDPLTLYYGCNRLFKSVDRGDNWVGISPDLSTAPGPERQGNVPFGTITTLSESALAQGLLYAGTDDGNVHVTRDDGRTWNNIADGLPDKWVSRVVASQHDEGTVYTTLTGYREDDFSAYAYKSNDFGKTWMSIASNLPGEPVNVIREDPTRQGILYLGTDLGAYVSIDDGEQWESIGNGLPTTAVHDLFVHAREGELIAGTHGRSVFVLDIEPLQVGSTATPDPPALRVGQSPLEDAEARIRAIYERGEFRAAAFRAEWLPDGSGYTTRERVPGSDERVSVAYDAASGRRTVLDRPPVRGPRGQLSPNGRRSLERDGGNLWIRDLEDDSRRRVGEDLTASARRNGRAVWSPDGTRVAFVETDESRVRIRSRLVPGDPSYPEVAEGRFARVGGSIASLRVGVVAAEGGEVRWLDLSPPPEGFYLGQVDWAGNSNELLIEKLSRFRDERELLLADVDAGTITRIYHESDPAWVVASYGLNAGLHWLRDGRAFLVLSEKDGWRHAYVHARDGELLASLTPGEYDIIERARVDEARGWFYFYASPDDAAQRYLYRVPLDASAAPERVTPLDQPGTHDYDFSADAEWALHTYSRFDAPPITELVQVPDRRVVRVLEDNAALRERVAPLIAQPTEFLQLELDAGVSVDAWMIKPRDFDPSRAYPLFVYVYGEPHAQTVLDAWGRAHADYHRVIADLGYLVVSIDNRGTPAPKGAAWRRAVAGSLGPLSTEEQAAAVQELARTRPYVDASRVGIWGWSGGGSNTLNAMFRRPDVYQVGIAVASKPQPRLYNAWFQEIYMQTPEVNPEGYRESAPLNFAAGLEGDLLLIHGTGELNTHVQIVEGLVDRLIELGKPFDYMSYPNRRHGLQEGRGTAVHMRMHMVRYLVDHLPPGPR